MNIGRMLLALFMTSSFLLTSVPATAASPRSLMVGGKQVMYSFQGLSAKASSSKYGGIMVHVMGPDGKPLNTVSKMFLQSAGKDAARKFKPSEIAKQMSLGKVMTSTVARWPMESFGFALAIGAINTAQLFFDYANNPVIIQQHLEYQKDPVGHVGFLAFMMANGVSHHTMTQILGEKTMTSSRFRHFFPFLGMSIGMVASNIVHEIGHFPGLKECALSKSGPEKDKACDAAYNAWLDLDPGEKMHEWAPGLLSLAASFFISGAIMSVASKVITVSAVEVAAMIIPGGVHIKIVRGVMWMVNMTLFTGIDTLIASMIMTPYRNWHQSNKLESIESTLYYALAGMKHSKWSVPDSYGEDCFITPFNSMRVSLGYDREEFCKGTFPGVIRKSSETLGEWRNFNMEPVMFAQANWSQYLGNLSASYGTTKEFYKYFLNDLWEKHYGRYKDAPNYTFPMDRHYPLHGIKPKGLTAEFRGDFLDNPTQIAQMQMEAVNDLVNIIARRRSEIGATMKTSEDRRAFEKEIRRLRESYQKTDGEPILKPEIVAEVMNRLNLAMKNPKTSPELKGHFANVLSALGKPYPLSMPGQGYAEYYRIHPEYGAALENFEFRKKTGLLKTTSFATSMWASMFWGPDVEKGASTISKNSVFGLPATFQAPRVYQWLPHFSGSVAPQPCERNLCQDIDFYNYSVTTGSGNTFKNHGTLFDYLSEGNVRSSILNKDRDAITKWWTKYPETEYYNAWLSYEEKYQQIIVNLLERMWRKDLAGIENPIPENSILNVLNPGLRAVRKLGITWFGDERSSLGPLRENGDSSFNDGPVANGTVEAGEQEMKMHLMILGEMFKDLYVAQYGETADYRNEFSKKVLKGLDVKAAKADMRAQALPLLRTLRNSDNLQFAYLGQDFSLLRNKALLGKVENNNLQWQEDVLKAFEDAKNVLAQIKPRQVRDKNGKFITVSTSHVSMQKIKEVKENAEKALADARKNIEGKIQITVYQKAIMDACFEGLDNVFNELVTFGQIANVVSYIEQSGSESGWQKPYCGKPEEGKRQAPGGMAVQRMVEGC